LFFRSIRFRLTLLYILSLAVILAASGFFLHFFLSRNLLDKIDLDLRVLAEGASSPSVLSPGAGCAPLEDVILQRGRGNYVEILDSGGKVVCAIGSPFLKELPPIGGEGGAGAETFAGEGTPPLRFFTLAAQSGGEIFFVRTAKDLTTYLEALRELRLGILALSPFALLAISLTGWFLAGRALAPMDRITRQVRNIKAENLSLRLPVENSQDEVGRLAETFNSMLGRLEESFRKTQQFSGDASHELRTPLAIIRGETEVSLRWAKSTEDFRRTLESNLEEIDRMGRIIEDLLTLAKSDAGEMPMEMKDLSLSDLLQELYLQGRMLGESKDMDVLLDVKVSEEIRIRGDELRLRQMFLNLISNAIKYTPEGGKVNITLALEGASAVVCVSDNGIGIPEKHLPHIFDRFYRIDPARNREAGGTGLGLAISKSIVEAHEGQIVAESIPVRGSTFTVYLPLKGPGPRKKNAFSEKDFR